MKHPRLLSRLAWLAMFTAAPVFAADHLDTPTLIADPAADIGDLFAWTSADGKRLNLIMDIVGKRFSDQVQYVFNVDSGQRLNDTTESTRLLCQFDTAGTVRCWAGRSHQLQGDASQPQGLATQDGRLRVFAGQRDDPYFNNVRGTRSALNAAGDAIKAGQAPQDDSGFHRFNAELVQRLSGLWGRTQGGPAQNFLAGWTTSALVMSVDLNLVNAGGPLLAVWGRTERRQAVPPGQAPPPPGAPIDRMGRALTGNALLATIGSDDIADLLKEAYNRADPAGWPSFATEIGRNLALYDSFDGVAGNQWLADAHDTSPARYQRLALLLAGDRLWVDSRQTRCLHYLAVERSAFGTPLADCGGRTPLQNVNAVFRSLLIRGTPGVADDGVTRDDHEHSTVDFPFLSPR